MDDACGTGPAVEKTRQFVAWLILTLEKFPRSQKFLLGDRIQVTALDVLEQLIEATYTRARVAPTGTRSPAFRGGWLTRGPAVHGSARHFPGW